MTVMRAFGINVRIESWSLKGALSQTFDGGEQNHHSL